MNNLTLSNKQELVFEDLLFVYDVIRGQIITSDSEDIIVNMYFNNVLTSKKIPDIEELASGIDDRNSGIIYETCFLMGLSEVDTDCIMGKYCHEVASDLDIMCQKILEKYNLPHICCGEMFCGENIHPGQNVLLSKWHT